ncbi:MAG: TonB family protein [Azoarcus sp.]|jgi:protein TonB|nr:TonB family protein [Azoarcus sp.]
MPKIPGSATKNFPWLGLALLLHGALLFAMPRGAAQIAPPAVAPLMVSLLDPAPAAAPQPASPPQVTPPKPRPPKPERPKRVRKPRSMPVQASRIPDPVESDPAPAPAEPQAVAAVSTASSNSAAKSAVDPVPGAFTNARFDAAYLHNPEPPYPQMSRRLGEEGKVMLRVYVLPNGSVEKVEIVKTSGFARLDKAARDAVVKWRFGPARQGNNAVASWVNVPIKWSLEKP